MFAGFSSLWNKQYYSTTRGGASDSSKYMSIVFCTVLLLSFGLVGCAGLNTSTNPTATTKAITATASLPQVALASLRWCGKPVQIFRDEGSAKTGTPTTAGTPVATPKTVTDWRQVEPSLGFTVFLPPTLPQGSCLISASGTIHDPTFGGIFTIGYVLPNHDAISLSEAPLASQSSIFQCSPSGNGGKSGTPTPGPTVEPVQLCTGAHGTTNVVLSARGATASLQQLFTTLEAHVAWIPTSSS